MKKISVSRFSTLALAATLLVGITSACTVKDDDRPANEDSECDAAVPLIDAGVPDATNVDASVDAPIDAGTDAPPAQCYISIERVGGDGSVSEENQSTETLRVCRRTGSNTTDPVCTGNALNATLAFTGSATRTSDYIVSVVGFSSQTQGTIQIGSGDGCATFVVAAQQDSINEGTENIDVCVMDTSFYQLGSPSCQQISIRDDDQVVNHTPDAMDDTATTLEDTATTIAVLANDTGLNDVPLTLTVSNPPRGSAVVVGNAVQYTPDADLCGSDQFSYTVRDADGQQDTATVFMNVTCVNDPVCPAVTLSFGITAISGGGGYTIAWDSNHADTCTASGTWNGARSIDGSVIVNPTAVGTYTYSLTCNSSCGTSATQQGTITVSGTPQPTLCHGEKNYYKQSDLANIQECWGYTRVSGVRHSLPKGTVVSGTDSVCSITCERFDDTTVLPLAVSGTWLPGGQEDAPRWYTTGCSRLPDHQSWELDDYLRGGTWDGRCALAVQTLSGPPDTNQ